MEIKISQSEFSAYRQIIVEPNGTLPFDLRLNYPWNYLSYGTMSKAVLLAQKDIVPGMLVVRFLRGCPQVFEDEDYVRLVRRLSHAGIRDLRGSLRNVCHIFLFPRLAEVAEEEGLAGMTAYAFWQHLVDVSPVQSSSVLLSEDREELREIVVLYKRLSRHRRKFFMTLLAHGASCSDAWNSATTGRPSSKKFREVVSVFDTPRSVSHTIPIRKSRSEWLRCDVEAQRLMWLYNAYQILKGRHPILKDCPFLSVKMLMCASSNTVSREATLSSFLSCHDLYYQDPGIDLSDVLWTNRTVNDILESRNLYRILQLAMYLGNISRPRALYFCVDHLGKRPLLPDSHDVPFRYAV